MSDFQKDPKLQSSIFEPRDGISELDQLLAGWAEGLTDEERREILEILSPSEDGDVVDEDKDV
jgi:hypothetical protein